MNKLVLGTAQLSGAYGISRDKDQLDLREVSELFGLAKKSGVRLLDTAQAYGESEQIIGRVAASEFEAITKISWRDSFFSQDILLETVDESLKRLGHTKLYGLLIHNVHEIAASDLGKVVEALQVVKTTDLALKVGLSFYSPEQLALLESLEGIDLVQCPFSILDRRIINSGLGKRLKNAGCEIHVRSVFLQGLFFIEPEDLNPYFSNYKDDLITFKNWCSDHKLSILEACLSFVMQEKLIDKLVVGFHNAKQLAEVMSSCERLRELNFDSLKLKFVDSVNLVEPSRWKLIY